MRLSLAATTLAVAAAQEWQYEVRNIATIALGIACPDDDTCFMGVSQDGLGNQVLVSDGSGGYRAAELGEGGQMPGQMMLMSTAAQASDSAVTVGMGFGNNAVFSDDGNFFDAGEAFTLMGISQNVKAIPGIRGGYGMVGDFVKVDGPEHDLAISMDGGNVWETHALPDGVLGGWSRYAHYVNDQTWYIAGGSWPTEDNFDAEKHHAYSELLTIDKNMGTFTFHNNTAQKSREGYVAGVVRTDDAGATWHRVFHAENEGFYLNEIDCPSRTVCFAVGEGQQSVRILRTVDGGATWDNIWNRAQGHSLMGIHFFDENEGWACGMRIEGGDFSTLFLHTRDGGVSWTENHVGQAMCTGMSFHGGNRRLGHATAIEPLSGQSSTLVYQSV